MVDGRSSKCDACADTTKAGGDPWCVTTCPSRALMYADRDDVLAEANARVASMKERYPNAQVYGETQAGGLGVIMVVPDDPEVLNLPLKPDPPLVSQAWQKVVQPGSIALTGVTVAAAGVAAVIARRNHMAELREVEEAEAAATAGTAETTEEV